MKRISILINRLQTILKSFFYSFAAALHKLLNATLRLLKFTRLVVKKVLAYFLLCHLYLINFASKGIGLVLLLIIFIMGFFGLQADSLGRIYMNIAEFYCAAFIVYLFFIFALFYILFRIPQFEKWAFKQLGEKRVRRLVYNSPAITSQTGKVLTTLGVAAGLMAGFEIYMETASQRRFDTDLKNAHLRYERASDNLTEEGKERLAAFKDHPVSRFQWLFHSQRVDLEAVHVWKDKEHVELVRIRQQELDSIHDRAKVRETRFPLKVIQAVKD